MKILNLTQHAATPEQVADGVVEPHNKKHVQQLLTFEELPTHAQIWDRACALTAMAVGHNVSHVMIGGAPFLMSVLETKLSEHGMIPVYSFTKREVIEQAETDGSIKKVSIFKHVGFVDAVLPEY